MHDLTGQKFGRLSVLNLSPVEYSNGRRWVCSCDCGGTAEVATGHLRAGTVTSCGCALTKTHGMSGTPEHNAWKNMKQRCLNESHPQYPDYGGRGVTIDPTWQNSFDAFYADMGPRPEGDYSIEREDVNGNYEPGNCKWLPVVQQPLNRRNTVYHEHNGEKVVESELARRHGLSPQTLRYRLAKGLTLEQALNKGKWSRD